MDRICTDPELERTVSIYAERFRGTLAIVVTKIDECISDELADALQAKGQDIGSFYETQAAISSVKELLKEVRRSMKSTKLTPSAKCDLRDREDLLMEQLRNEESRRFECLVIARNEHIERRLQSDKKKHQLADSQFPIHFVSNKQYEIHKQPTESESGPILQITATGIPRLRSYALCLAAPGVWKSHEDHLKHKIKVVFHGVHGWADGKPGNRDKSLMECVNGVSEFWTIGKDAQLERLTADFQVGTIQSLREAHTASLQGAMRWYDTITSNPWWWHNRFLASYRNDGTLRKPVRAAKWNESFIEGQTKDALNPAWKKLPSPDSFFDDAVKKLNCMIEDLPDQLERLPSSVPLPMVNFERILESQIAGIEAAHHKRKMKYQQELANIKLDATTDLPTGYFSQAMQPCYDAGKWDKGKKVCTRIKALIYNHIVHQDPLSTATDSLAEALYSNGRHHALLLDKDVKRILVDTAQQFRMILERGAETTKEREARRQIVVSLVSPMTDVGRIDTDLAQIRQMYPGV